MKTSNTWTVTEDNGGTLTLYVWDKNTLVFAHRYSNPYALKNDLEALNSKYDNDTSEWNNNELEGEPATMEDYLEYIDEHEIIGDVYEIFNSKTGAVPADEMGEYSQEIFYSKIIRFTH